MITASIVLLHAPLGDITHMGHQGQKCLNDTVYSNAQLLQKHKVNEGQGTLLGRDMTLQKYDEYGALAASATALFPSLFFVMFGLSNPMYLQFATSTPKPTDT